MGSRERGTYSLCWSDPRCRSRRTGREAGTGRKRLRGKIPRTSLRSRPGCCSPCHRRPGSWWIASCRTGWTASSCCASSWSPAWASTCATRPRRWPVAVPTKSLSPTAKRTTSALLLACGSGDGRGAYGAHSTSDQGPRRARSATSSRRFAGNGLALDRCCWRRLSGTHPSQLQEPHTHVIRNLIALIAG